MLFNSKINTEIVMHEGNKVKITGRNLKAYQGGNLLTDRAHEIDVTAAVGNSDDAENTITIDGVTLIARGPQGCGKTRMLERIQKLLEKPKPMPFDLEAAKRGEPIEYLVKGNWLPCLLVGPDPRVEEFAAVVQHDDYGFTAVEPVNLRMTPKPKRTVWVNIYPGNHSLIKCSIAYHTEQAARDAAGSPFNFIDIAVPIEIDA